MAWTTPRTWAAADVPAAAGGNNLNLYVRDNLLYLYGSPRCRARRNAEQTILTATNTAVAWNAEDYDTDGFHDNASNNDRITVPSSPDLSGDYYASVQVSWSQNGTGLRTMVAELNGSSNVMFNAKSPESASVDVAHGAWRIRRMAVADWINLDVLQNSGSSLTLRSDSRSPIGILHWIGKV